ncbi:hypothetical protein M422DRAFT_266873 [Sphaerobolus stellatus SS14]|uniref:Zn(2)-C6 fungal-type domain-containing protein n=1 Tax=Sphaerobolus stellatus (strain SS14) TaxID=990650 RepID=A0A0C9V1Z5_SPHS4|nr:hypothetical protein M422DRAFT_266873 [Sphaerobolus stellatus SS14]
MTNTPIPAHILAWKASTDMIRMGEILSADPRRTVRGFVPDKKFDAPAPTLAFNDPYENDEDRLNKVKKYWKVHDKERMLREACYKELLDAEVQAAKRRKAEENAWAMDKAKKEAAAREKEKEKEKGLEMATREKEKTVELEKEKEKEAGPSGNAKGKAREVPRMPRKVTPKKSQPEVQSESEDEGEEDEEKLRCIYCVKKNIPCVPQAGKKVCVACGKRKMKCEFFDKTAWAVMDGSKQIADSMWELVSLERRREAGRLEGVWYDLQRFLVEVEQWVAMDSAAADAKLLQLLELKSKRVDIPVDLEKWICMERGLVQDMLKEHTTDLTERMDALQKCTAWAGNGLPRINQESTPVPLAAIQGTKRKNDNEGNHAEGGKKKKKKKMVETAEGSSTLH